MTPEQIKRALDLHTLAEALGLERPQAGGNYRSPHHPDANPSLSVFTRPDGQGWKDWSSDEGGDAISLVQYVQGVDFGAAMDWLHERFGLEKEPPGARRREELSLAEYIAERCLEATRGAGAQAVLEYLTGRGIPEAEIDRAIKLRAIGWNDWHSPRVAPGEAGHGGPGVAFVVRTPNPGHVVAVDTRYRDPALNGGIKSNSQGEKLGAPWCRHWREVQQARTVYLVESPINALSVHACGLPGTAALALRGTQTVEELDLRPLLGKQIRLAMDYDEVQKSGRRPGQEAAWVLYERLTAAGIATMLVRQDQWEHNDCNDILQAAGIEGLRSTLQELEPWAIAGLPGGKEARPGRTRVFLPPHDLGVYWKYRVKEDFTSQIVERTDPETGETTQDYHDLCGFRVAALARVQVASAMSTMTGERDAQPVTLFAVTVQAPRHGPQLQRRVFEDEQLHNLQRWQHFGPVFNAQKFSRLVSILERSAHRGAREAVNFVGLAWRGGQVVVNEGPDCYFRSPEQQCPYHNLRFPSGPVSDAQRVLMAYQETFTGNAAALVLVWALGAHLKVFLGFWPHLVQQARKGAGKTTLCLRLARTIAMQMFSGQSINTEYRQLTSLSHTSHPIGWEELSARQQQVIDRAVSLLQEAYQFQLTRRGSEMLEYLVSAPVLLAGEDVPVDSLLGKVVRTDLSGKKGPMLPEDLPRFPVLEWLQWLARLDKAQVQHTYNQALTYCQGRSMAAPGDDGARRIAGNYAALMTAWRLLCDFSGLDQRTGDFLRDCLAEQNRHIAETAATREPWVRILEITLSELDAGTFRHPYTFDQVPEGEGLDLADALLIRTSHIMAHLSTAPHLRDKFSALTIKSDRVFKRQLKDSGVLVGEREFERTIHDKRVSHLVAIRLNSLDEYGLAVSRPDTTDQWGPKHE